MGLISGKPIIFPGGRILTVVLAVVAVAGTALLVLGAAGTVTLDGTVSVLVLGLILASALVFGVTMVLPIGGADMPVVISLLNAFTGTAVAMAGFVLDNPVLIISGALVGASGGILTKLMADAMNRSILNIMIGGFGGGEGTDAAGAGGPGGSVRSIGADDVAIQLAYASNVIVVPGYGLAVAQAQHAVRELAELLEEKGVDVSYAIHPVAGRMPGHMNVLLAEANVPYPLLKEMDEINPEFDRCDVALVIGANDVTNPAARRPGNPVSGMPILDVDHAKSIIVIKRSMGRGYAGIDNELYVEPQDGHALRRREGGPRGPRERGQGAVAGLGRRGRCAAGGARRAWGRTGAPQPDVSRGAAPRECHSHPPAGARSRSATCVPRPDPEEPTRTTPEPRLQLGPRSARRVGPRSRRSACGRSCPANVNGAPGRRAARRSGGAAGAGGRGKAWVRRARPSACGAAGRPTSNTHGEVAHAMSPSHARKSSQPAAHRG